MSDLDENAIQRALQAKLASRPGASNYDDKAAGKAAMKNILNKFQNATKSVARTIVHEARSDQAFNTAMHTQQLPNHGVQYHNFAVFPNNATGKTRYDVVNMTTQQKVTENLYLVETAQAIVKMLNKQYSFYSPQINDILNMETTYIKHYNDAVTFKRKNPDGFKDAIMETRFNESKNKAGMAKKLIVELNEKLK